MFWLCWLLQWVNEKKMLFIRWLVKGKRILKKLVYILFVKRQHLNLFATPHLPHIFLAVMPSHFTCHFNGIWRVNNLFKQIYSTDMTPAVSKLGITPAVTSRHPFWSFQDILFFLGITFLWIDSSSTSGFYFPSDTPSSRNKKNRFRQYHVWVPRSLLKCKSG
jgi:hypothetical protein